MIIWQAFDCWDSYLGSVVSDDDDADAAYRIARSKYPGAKTIRRVFYRKAETEVEQPAGVDLSFSKISF